MTKEPTRDRLAICAIVIALAAVLARGTMLESVRDPFEVTPGSVASARTPGPAAGLVLDVVCCLPALLVLLNRTLRKTSTRHKSLACVLGGLLAVWTLASVLWADDKFAAVVSASHFAAAMALLWAMSQLVTSWSRLRLVAAMAHGLLLVYFAQAMHYRYSEWPDMVDSYLRNKALFLRERDWNPNDFMARQFEKKLMSGEMVFFHGSANSFAATLVLLMGISGGLVIDRVTARQKLLAAVTAAAIGCAAWIVYLTQSKAAFVTPVLIAVFLLIYWRWKAKITFARGLAVVLACAAGLLALGFARHGLPGASLNFRWRYWTAAWQMFMARPWLGAGWDNFGLHYLHYRLPIAAEEIQDPHNFLMRWLTELGIVGAALGITWLGRMWWELSRELPALAPSAHLDFGTVIVIALVSMAIACAAAVDYSMGWPFWTMEMLKRLLFFCVMVVGAAMAGMKSVAVADIDDRPAPWVLAAMLASLGAFLVHNLIEFSFFETGPMMLFALLAGSALGVRRPAVPVRPTAATIGLVGATVVLVVAVATLVIPVIEAESLAQDGDQLLRASRFDEASADYLRAFRDYADFNADYANRAALAESYNRTGAQAAKRLLDEAITANPSAVKYHLSRAGVEAELRDGEAAKADFAAALELDPNEVSIRMDYAGLLKQMGLTEKANEQYELALKYNDLLSPDEPKRISDAVIRGQMP